ncbi:MAG TPA: flavodoxin domain-containing protein [Candidatus Limnocylindrales bacterium]|jgi:menaquinone-dependent protoporphyrinogen IX oxidase|nr:flavodoxin domain-containing protein [Candidatus Limnocylindrales bacterium]
MNVLVVYSSKFGNTERLARAIGTALESTATVRVVEAGPAENIHGDGVDLLIVGAPTQVHGLLLGVRGFLRRLKDRGFSGRRAAAFDTRMAGDISKTGSAAQVIGRMLKRAGLTLVVAPESFLVADYEGPLADREEARAMNWAQRVAAFEGALP